MLIQVQPDKVSEHWEFFAPVIKEALPPITTVGSDGMASVLRAALIEDLQVWIYEGNDGVVFVMSTTVYIDPIMGTHALLIYSLTAIRELTQEVLEDAYKTLKGFARARGHEKIVAFSSHEHIVRLVKNLGGQNPSHFIELPI